jgi:hypothetical protein
MNVAWRLVKVNELNTAKRLILKHFELGIGILMHLSEMMITSKTRKGPQKIKGNIKACVMIFAVERTPLQIRYTEDFEMTICL